MQDDIPEKKLRELLKKDTSRIKKKYIPQSMKNSLNVDPEIYSEMILRNQEQRKKRYGSNLENEHLDESFALRYDEQEDRLNSLLKTPEGEVYLQMINSIERVDKQRKSAEFIQLMVNARYGGSGYASIEKFLREDEIMKTHFEILGISLENIVNLDECKIRELGNGVLVDNFRKKREEEEKQMVAYSKDNNIAYEIQEIQNNFQYVSSLTKGIVRKYERIVRDLERKLVNYNVSIDRYLPKEVLKYYNLVDREKVASKILNLS